MSLQAVPNNQIIRAVEATLDYLNDGRNATPNDKLEAIVSGKSILRGIMAGDLVICQEVEDDTG